MSNDMNVQAFAEQIAVYQHEAHEREKKVTHLWGLLRQCNEILKHAPEFPFYLIAKYDIEDLQDELAKEIKNV